MVPLAGSILVVGGARITGGSQPCDKCHAEVTRLWQIRCAFCYPPREHYLCAKCLTAAQKAACADPEGQIARWNATAERITPTTERTT